MESLVSQELKVATSSVICALRRFFKDGSLVRAVATRCQIGRRNV